MVNPITSGLSQDSSICHGVRQKTQCLHHLPSRSISFLNKQGKEGQKADILGLIDTVCIYHL